MVISSEMTNNTTKGENTMERKQFTFYRSFYVSIEKLQTNKEKLQAYETICRYALYGQEPDISKMKPSVATLFEIIRPVLDTAHKRAEQAKKLSEHKQTECGNV